MGKGEGSRAEAEENDLSCGAQENCGGAASTVGEGEARGVRERLRGGDAAALVSVVSGKRALRTRLIAPGQRE